jgi:hypothetical protein
MALVTTIAYFHTAGFTESGSLPNFLKKINPNVNWQRGFPAYQKTKIAKGPHGSTPIKQPRSQDSGITGEALINKMKAIVSEYKHDYLNIDWFVVVDDLDCSTPRDIHSLEQEMSLLLGRPVRCVILYAAPEVEAWFIADWNHSFGKHYPSAIANQLWHALSRYSPRVQRNSIEMFGGPMKAQGGCTTKLSEVIQRIFYYQINAGHRAYSKRYDGNEMLNNIEPEIVAQVCTTHFLPAYRQLSQIK